MARMAASRSGKGVLDASTIAACTEIHDLRAMLTKRSSPGGAQGQCPRADLEAPKRGAWDGEQDRNGCQDEGQRQRRALEHGAHAQVRNDLDRKHNRQEQDVDWPGAGWDQGCGEDEAQG